MIVSPSVVAAAKNKGAKFIAASGLPGEPYSQVEAVVDLLATSTSPAAQPGARRLLHQMSSVPWTVIRGAHRSARDATLHVLIEIAKTRYHLRLDARSFIFDITFVSDNQTERPAGSAPWEKPGA